MKKRLIVLSSALALTPFLVLAANNNCSNFGTPGTIEYIICRIGNIFNVIIPILIVLGVLYFVWGVISYVIGSDEEAKKKGRDRIIYGIIGLVVIVGMWGLVRIVLNTFGNPEIDPGFVVPCVPGTPGC